MFAFGNHRPPRRPGLTPMVDVVFLLLVFFMLAARFGQDSGLTLSLGGGVNEWSGPPRLITVSPDQVALNGVVMPLPQLPEALTALMQNPNDAVILRARGGADVQKVIDVMAALRSAGHTSLILAGAEETP